MLDPGGTGRRTAFTSVPTVIIGPVEAAAVTTTRALFNWRSPIVPTAVVTGPLEHVADMALALKVAGFEVLAAEPEVRQISAGLGEVDCYVQLPNGAPPAGNDARSSAHAIVAHTLLSRLAAAAHLAPTLAANAAVVLVTDPDGETPSPDMGLVRLLIKAIICNHAGDNVRVSVIDGTRSPEDIIGATRPPTASLAPYPSIDPHLAFADWRNEIICLSSLDPWT